MPALLPEVPDDGPFAAGLSASQHQAILVCRQQQLTALCVCPHHFQIVGIGLRVESSLCLADAGYLGLRMPTRMR